MVRVQGGGPAAWLWGWSTQPLSPVPVAGSKGWRVFLSPEGVPIVTPRAGSALSPHGR